MEFRLCEHTADVAVEAAAADLDGVFAAVADGLAAAACDDVPEPGADASRFEVSVAAESREALLFDYLDQLIYERDVRGVLPVRNRVEIEASGGGVDGDGSATESAGVEAGAVDSETGGSDRDTGAADSGTGAAGPAAGSAWRLAATARGVPLEAVDARDIKAVTYSEMRLEPTDEGWTAYVVFDV